MESKWVDPQRRDACHFITNTHNYYNIILPLMSLHTPASLFQGSVLYLPSKAWTLWLSPHPTEVTHQ